MRERMERGSALVETVFLLVLLTLPTVYLIATLARLQAGAYAVSAAAREAGRTFVTAAEEAHAGGRAATAAQLVFDAHGFGDGSGGVQVACAAEPCLTPGASVEVLAAVDVDLPLVPAFLDGAVPTTIQLTSTHVEPVDRFRQAQGR